MKAVYILISLFISSISFAQSDFRPGYIISSENDTLYGFIDFRSDIRNSLQCTFHSDNGEKTVYHPFAIKGYRFTNGKYYISKWVKNQTSETVPLFVEYLVDGEKDLFYYRSTEGNNYLINYNDSTLVLLPFQKKTNMKDGRYYGVQSTQHIGFLKSYFEDAPELYHQIEKIQQPGVRNLTKLTKDYHELKCSDSVCIIYNKAKNKFRMAIEPVFGYYKFKASNDFKPQYGAHLYFWLPQNNENLYAKTGLLFYSNNADINTETETIRSEYTYYTMPIAFEYQLPYKRIKPKFNLGMNLHFIHQQDSNSIATLSAYVATGMLVKVTRNIYFDTELTSDLFGFAREKDVIRGIGYRSGVYWTF